MNRANLKLAAGKNNSIHRYLFGDGGINTLTGGGVEDHFYGGGDSLLSGLLRSTGKKGQKPESGEAANWESWRRVA